MINQELADYLIREEKSIIERSITFPFKNENLILNVVCNNNNMEKLLIDINRKGTFKLTRCTYQNRYQLSIPLVRLDIDTKPHRNPDNTIVSPTHIHIYREGFMDRWAYPLDEFDVFRNTNDLIQTFLDFCEYCNIKCIPIIQGVIR